MEELEFDACIDTIDNRDYPYDEIFGTELNLPDEFIIDDLEDYQNQGLEEISRMMCVFYSSTHGVNILNELEGLGEENKSGKESGLYANKQGLLDLNKGAYLSSGPKVMKELGFIKGYALCKNEYDVKKSIVDGRPVVVGSNKLKWGWPCVPKDSYGHAVLIIGYNEHGFIIKQSYGKEKRNEGRNLLLYKDFDRLYNSKYSLIDVENPILKYKENIMKDISIEKAKEAFLNGFWNGKNPKAPVTREECATMIQALFDKVK